MGDTSGVDPSGRADDRDRGSRTDLVGPDPEPMEGAVDLVRRAFDNHRRTDLAGDHDRISSATIADFCIDVFRNST